MEESAEETTVALAIFTQAICLSDFKQLHDQRHRVASSLGLGDMERTELNELNLRCQYEDMFFRMFEMWMKKVAAKDEIPTLRTVANIFTELKIKSVEVNLKNRFVSLDKVIVTPKEPAPPAESEEADADKDKSKEEGEDAVSQTKEDGKGKKKKGFNLFSKKNKVPSAKDAGGLAGGIAGNSLLPGQDGEEDEDTPEEAKHLPEEYAKQLETLIAPIHKLDTSFQIIQYLSRAVDQIGACVPKEDDWVQKVALVAMEMFSIVRHFVEPGNGIRKSQFEGVVRRYVVDPGLAPQLIGALVVSGMLIPKHGEKKSVLLVEPAIKDAIDDLLKSEAVLKLLGGSYPTDTKVQEKLLVAVVASVEEYRSVDDQKAFGKKLSPHISYLVREIIWPRKHHGFNNLQAKIPKVIRFCTESVIAVAKQRYEYLPNVSCEDLAIFRKAYEKAQKEKMSMAGIAAGAALGVGAVAGVAALGSVAVMNED